MTYNPNVQYIPALPPQREIRVGIYSRVSSNSMNQLNSLTSQISALTRMVATVPKWLLAVLLFVKIAGSYMEYKKHGQLDWTAPAILFFCLFLP